MTTYSTPRCPRCKSLLVFRAWNSKLRRDDGVCKKKGCFHKTDFQEFIETGAEYDRPEADFDKDRYYRRKQAV